LRNNERPKQARSAAGPGYTSAHPAFRNSSSVKPPQIDTTPGSPTYGQAMVDGHVVASAADAGTMLDQQQIEQIAAWQAQNQEAFDSMTPFATIPGISDWSNPLDALNPSNWSPNTILLVGLAVAAVFMFGSRR